MIQKNNNSYISPTGTYQISLPRDIRSDISDDVFSYWRDGSSVLLQLSSYIRNSGPQVEACERLRERIASTPGKWLPAIYIKGEGEKPNRCSAQQIDSDGILWIHTYCVWPKLAIYITLSGNPETLHSEGEWGFRALESLRSLIK